MSKNVRIIKTDEEFKIVADPYRMKILSVFLDHEEPKTVKQVADLLHEVPANIHYHVKKLLSIQIIELDHIEEINGINAKYYRATANSIKFDVRDDLKGMGRSIQVDRMTKVLFDNIDSFKDDLIKRANEIKTLEHKEIVDDGFLSSGHIYLTKDDFEEINTYLKEFYINHRQKKPNSIQYASLFGVIKKTDDTQP